MQARQRNSNGHLLLAAFAAFCTYFCMYAFRKPFNAGTYAEHELWGLGLKSLLVTSQISGYMVSKFIGIKVISEMPPQRRAWAILGLIALAELALVGFAVVPIPFKVVMLFLNGLPLGMVFGLVLSYLEGRQQTEALSAALCASFIVSSGVVKSVGRWLIEDWGVSEFQMPMLTGLLFTVPLMISVYLLQRTPAPDARDLELRQERTQMHKAERRQFLKAYWPGLFLLVAAYVALTIIRTIRDDFGVEIWSEMGVTETPSVFARSETVVGICVTLLSALSIWIVNNLWAIRITITLMCVGFLLTIASALLQMTDSITPFQFMVICGVGIYIPYVAYHTAVFERLLAASRHRGNLGFLMYLADSIGYLGYCFVMLRMSLVGSQAVLPFFLNSLLLAGGISIVALLAAMIYFQRTLSREHQAFPLACAVPDQPVSTTADAAVSS